MHMHYTEGAISHFQFQRQAVCVSTSMRPVSTYLAMLSCAVCETNTPEVGAKALVHLALRPVAYKLGDRVVSSVDITHTSLLILLL